MDEWIDIEFHDFVYIYSHQATELSFCGLF